tara:strand:+ start:601 stop:807 length:207 start_codon:yes stop_codon:yes gene_type:complete
MDIKKYKLVTTQEMLELSEDLRKSSRMSVAKDKAIIEYDQEVEGGLTNQEIIDYIEGNWLDWNEPDLV